MNTSPIIPRYRWSELDSSLQSRLLERPQRSGGVELSASVQQIIDQVREQGDAALRELTRMLVAAMHRALAHGVIPPHTDKRARCRGCSLIDIQLELRRIIKAVGPHLRESGVRGRQAEELIACLGHFPVAEARTVNKLHFEA